MSRATHLLPYLLIFTISAGVSTMVVAIHGIQTGGDSGRYTTAAARVSAGQLPTDNKGTSYLGFVAVLAATIALTGRAEPIVALNILAVALAACAVFAMARRLFGVRGGVIAAALLITNIELARWSAFILTDAMYLSFVTIATLAMYEARGRKGAAIAPALLVVWFTASIRPNGWLMIPIAAMYCLGRLAGLGLIVVAIAIMSVSPALRAGTQGERLETALTEGRVIFGSDAWRVPMPPADKPPANWSDGFRYAIGHPLASARLALTRIGTELVHARPSYSAMHNLGVVAFYLPIYGLAIIGLMRVRHHPLAQLVGVVVASHLVLVGLTYADFDGRFLLHVTPLIGTLASGGLAALPLARRSEQPDPLHASPT